MVDSERCGGSGMIAYWDGSAYAGEFCRGCIDCERHDSQCETELTSHGYTPCRCAERSGEPPSADAVGQRRDNPI
jgi:prepilin-type processing-associated H-X9-DG protein